MHVVVVLVPLAALGVVAVALVPPWRRRYAGLVVLLASAALASVPVATTSGEWLRDRLRHPAEAFHHGHLGDRLVWFVLPLWLVGLLLWRVDRARLRPALAGVLAGGAVVLAVLAIWQTVEVGQSGAELVWRVRMGSAVP